MKDIKLTGSDIRLRGLILSGGGQPNLWPHFEKLVNWLSTLDIDIGLITNGFPKNINDNIYDKLNGSDFLLHLKMHHLIILIKNSIFSVFHKI